MKFFYMFIVLIVFNNVFAKNSKYVNYTEFGQPFLILYTEEDTRLGSSFRYEDCSDEEFKCAKVDNEYYFFPVDLSKPRDYVKGDKGVYFTSKFGNYVIADQLQMLPFDLKYSFHSVILRPYTKDQSTLFFNQKKGIISMIYPEGEGVLIIWLLGNCGLLSDESCVEEW